MSGEMMTFPKTWEEYEKYWGFNDSDEVYTNNARLIPSFRVKQWLDHIKKAEPKKGRWTVHGEPPMYVIECSCCGQKYFNHVGQSLAKYCSSCGAKMEVAE